MRAPAAALDDLRVRTVTGVAIALAAAAPIVIGGALATLFVASAAALMGWEFRRMTAAPDAPAYDAPLYGAGLAISTTLAGAGQPFWAIEALTVTGVGFAVVDGLRGRATGWPVIGAASLGLGAACFAALRSLPEDGLLIVLWVALIVAATDIGAFFAGRLIGGPRIWPAVSPNKTWAGLAGGVALAAVTGLAFSGATTGTFYEEVMSVSAVAALVAQGGDLAESALKRRFGAKDSGSLLPGHGGALDRLDGFVAVTLVAGAVTFARGVPVFRW